MSLNYSLWLPADRLGLSTLEVYQVQKFEHFLDSLYAGHNMRGALDYGYDAFTLRGWIFLLSFKAAKLVE